mgnify:CR=1 FL=1
MRKGVTTIVRPATITAIVHLRRLPRQRSGHNNLLRRKRFHQDERLSLTVLRRARLGRRLCDGVILVMDRTLIGTMMGSAASRDMGWDHEKTGDYVPPPVPKWIRITIGAVVAVFVLLAVFARG